MLSLGGFNSHITSWGYQASNEDGDLLEEWAEVHHLDLIHDAKLPPSFNSCRWRRGYNPDLAFTSDRITCQYKKQVLEPIPHSQHRPITIAISAAVVPQKVPLRRRFNFQKANWEQFARSLDLALLDLEPVPSNYDQFVKKVQETSRKCIPRGCREHYIPGISPDSASLYETYSKLYEEDPFLENTMNAGETLMATISEDRRKSWQDLMRVLIWLTTVSGPGQPSRISTMSPKKPHCTPMSQQTRLLISCFWTGNHHTRHATKW